ncbi:MAG: FAD-dependent oxidoreductase [Desertimonas sp.]
MLVDGRHVARGTRFRVDVCIVGAGPAGLTAARALAADGISVMLMEAAGRHHRRADDDGLRGTTSGDPFPLVASRHRGFGGTSTHWTAATGLRLRPLDDIDFSRSSARPHDSWPFGRDQLEPWYRKAHEALGAPADYRDEPLAVDAPDGDGGGLELALFRFVDHAIFTRQYDEFVKHPLITVGLHAPLRSIEVDPHSGRVEQVRAAAGRGGDFVVDASVFVLATGALDNARMLLSSPGLTGAGVGNEHDLVGRFFMDHLSIDAGVVECTSPTSVPLDLFEHHRRDGHRTHSMLWLGDTAIEQNGLVNAAFWVDQVDPLYLSAGVGAARSMLNARRCGRAADALRLAPKTLRGLPDLARFGAERSLHQHRRSPVIKLRVLAEQLPHRDSRVRLSDRRDRFGIRRLELDWRVSDDDRRRIAEHYRALAQTLERAGIARLRAPYEGTPWASPTMTNYHHLGTTRMDTMAARGVVDADCRVHSAPNLFVLGGSVFPTGGYVNPTLTILALAHRAAHKIRQELATTVAVRPSATATIRPPTAVTSRQRSS